MVKVRLETSREHVAEPARLRDPVGAVEELIWNAVDGAQAPPPSGPAGAPPHGVPAASRTDPSVISVISAIG